MWGDEYLYRYETGPRPPIFWIGIKPTSLYTYNFIYTINSYNQYYLGCRFHSVVWHGHIYTLFWIRKNQMQTVTAATCMWWSVLEECRWPVAHWSCWLHWGAVTVECSVWAQDDGNRGGTCTACRIQVRELGPYRSLDASMHFTAVYIQCLPGSHFQGWKVFFQLQFL